MPDKKSLIRTAALLMAAAAGFLYLGTRGEPEPAAGTVAFAESEWTSEAASSEESLVWVYVCGAVCQEGVYMLPAGSRYQTALEAAGGFSEEADRSFLNLAAVVADGERILVPTQEEAVQLREAESLHASEEQAASDGRIDLNTADKAALMTLPGIGEAKAEAILLYRQENGEFQDIEEIMKVPGIKQGAFDKIKARIKVGIDNG